MTYEKSVIVVFIDFLYLSLDYLLLQGFWSLFEGFLGKLGKDVGW